MDEISISKKVNDFIESLKQDVHSIEIETIGDETIIIYEDWTEHPPILNYKSNLKEPRRHLTEEQRAKMSESKIGKKHTEEHKEKIRQSTIGREFSDIHKHKISVAKLLYYKNKKNKQL